MPITNIRGQQILNGTVQYVDIQQVAANRLLGNPTSSAANMSEISLGTGLGFSGSSVVLSTNLQSLSALSYSSASFVKMNAAGSFVLDPAVYITAAQTYFIGTTQNALNRSSAVQTLTGISIDGNAATVTGFKNIGNIGVQAVAGSNQSCTTAQFLTWYQTNYAFKSYYYTVAKCTWDYAANNDISDTSIGACEMAGTVIETFSDGSTYTIRITRPTTGTGSFVTLVYNDQGSGYSPGWRTDWNSTNLTNLNQLTNGPGYTTNTGTVTSVGGTGTVSGLTLNGTVTTSGNLTLGGTLSLTAANVNAVGAITNNTSGNAATAGLINVDNTVTYGRSGLQFAQSFNTAGNDPSIHQTPTAAWWHVLRMNHGNNAGFYADLAFSLTTNTGLARRVISDGVQLSNWVTILDALNYNSYAPTLTGGGASGTWSINVTGSSSSTTYINYVGLGNATSNISGGQTQVIRNENGTGGNLAYAPILHVAASDTMWQIQGEHTGNTTLQWRGGYQGTWYAWRTIWHNGNLTNLNQLTNGPGYLTAYIDTLATVTARGASTSTAVTLSSSNNYYNGHHYFIAYDATGNHYPHYNAGSDATGAVVNMRVYGAGGAIKVFLLNGKTGAISWDGNTLLHAGNYNSYSPTLTGGNASGTWGISISGNAATATISSQVTINYGNDSNSNYYMLWGSGNSVYATGGIYCNPFTDIVYAYGYRGSGNVGGTGEASWHPAGIYCGSTMWQYGEMYKSNTGINDVSEIYVNQWFRNNTTNTGVYNQITQQYWSSKDTGYWDASSTTTVSSIRFYTGGHVGNIKGYVFANSINELGFKDFEGTWIIRTVGIANTYLTGNFTASGDVTAYSDSRIKTNVKTIDNALEKVISLRGVKYNRTDVEDKSEKIGVIAQEIQQVLPQVVTEDDAGMLGVSYGNLAAVFIEAIKEQQNQIENLKKQIQYLVENR